MCHCLACCFGKWQLLCHSLCVLSNCRDVSRGQKCLKHLSYIRFKTRLRVYSSYANPDVLFKICNNEEYKCSSEMRSVFAVGWMSDCSRNFLPPHTVGASVRWSPPGRELASPPLCTLKGSLRLTATAGPLINEPLFWSLTIHGMPLVPPWLHLHQHTAGFSIVFIVMTQSRKWSIWPSSLPLICVNLHTVNLNRLSVVK